MTFVPKTWVDGDAGGTPITADELNRIEAGIAAAAVPPALAAVATSGSYADLSGTPTIPTVPTLATVATTGSYTDLTNKPTIGSLTLTDLPAGVTVTVLKSGTTWPARPTTRTDIIVAWKGADPSPPIVGSGTGGMLDNVDFRLVTP